MRNNIVIMDGGYEFRYTGSHRASRPSMKNIYIDTFHEKRFQNREPLYEGHEFSCRQASPLPSRDIPLPGNSQVRQREIREVGQL